MQTSEHHLPTGFILHNLDKHYMNVRMWSQAVHDYSSCVSAVLLHRQTAVLRAAG